jgi:hypothetical protein
MNEIMLSKENSAMVNLIMGQLSQIASNQNFLINMTDAFIEAMGKHHPGLSKDVQVGIAKRQLYGLLESQKRNSNMDLQVSANIEHSIQAQKSFIETKFGKEALDIMMFEYETGGSKQSWDKGNLIKM